MRDATYLPSKKAHVDLSLSCPDILTPDVSHIIELDRPWELQLIDLQTTIVAPTVASSNAATVVVLDNASNNDVAVEYLAQLYGFIAAWHRLRCGPHTINLVGQTVMFGKDKDAYENSLLYEKDDEQFMADWRRQGPLGVFLDIVNYISTPKQHSSFATPCLFRRPPQTMIGYY